MKLYFRFLWTFTKEFIRRSRKDRIAIVSADFVTITQYKEMKEMIEQEQLFAVKEAKKGKPN
jgi:hypothetical protein